MWTLIEMAIPNSPEAKYWSQITSPNNLLTVASALKSIGITDIKLYNFLKERNPNIIYSENIVCSMGEATCMSYLYNYAEKYLKALREANLKSNIYLIGYHAWLYKDKFKDFIMTDPITFENDIIKKTDYVEWHNDWETNDWDWMRKNVNSKTKGIRATIRATRGCAWGICSMCPVAVVYPDRSKHTRNSVDWVMQEIDTLYNKYNIREQAFLDDNLFSDKDWGKDLLNRIITAKYKGIHFTFEEGLTVPQALDEELVSMLKQAKFYHIKLGVEAFDKETLDLIQKPYRDPDQAIAAIKMLQKYKLNPVCFICIGFPTNTEESIKRDIKILIDLKVKLRVQILWKYPGINFSGEALSREKLKALQKYAMNATGSCAWRKKK